MFVQIGLKALTQKSKCLGTTFCWMMRAFYDGHSGMIHILGFHHSWNTYREVLGDNIIVLMKMFKPLRNWVVARKNCMWNKVEMCLEGTLCSGKAIIIMEKYLHDEWTMLTAPMHNGNWMTLGKKIRGGMKFNLN